MGTPIVWQPINLQDQKLNHKKLVFFIKISVLKDEQASSQTNDLKEHD